jgi:tRNA(Leu) C34 or U34 (ribose-2'-O)-methylase TrmL
MRQPDGSYCDAACQAPALAEFQATVANISGNIAQANAALGANITVGALMYDCEKVEWSHAGANYHSDSELPQFLGYQHRAPYPPQKRIVQPQPTVCPATDGCSVSPTHLWAV